MIKMLSIATFSMFFIIYNKANKKTTRSPLFTEIFSAAKSSDKKFLQRQETSDSNYSLCQENRLEEASKSDANAEEDASNKSDNKQSADLNRIEPYYLRLTMGKPVDREVSR